VGHVQLGCEGTFEEGNRISNVMDAGLPEKDILSDAEPREQALPNDALEQLPAVAANRSRQL
jgi:hypothetical protein